MLEKEQQQHELNKPGKKLNGKKSKPVVKECENEIVSSKKDIVTSKRETVTSRIYFRDTSKCFWFDLSKVDAPTKDVYDKLKEGDEISFMFIEQPVCSETYTLLYLIKITAYYPAPSFTKAIKDVVFGTFGLMSYTSLKVKDD